MRKKGGGGREAERKRRLRDRMLPRRRVVRIITIVFKTNIVFDSIGLREAEKNNSEIQN